MLPNNVKLAKIGCYTRHVSAFIGKAPISFHILSLASLFEHSHVHKRQKCAYTLMSCVHMWVPGFLWNFFWKSNTLMRLVSNFIRFQLQRYLQNDTYVFNHQYSIIYLHKVACGFVCLCVCHLLSVTLQRGEGLVVMGRGMQILGSVRVVGSLPSPSPIHPLPSRLGYN